MDRCRGRRRQGRGAHDAGHRRHEHELPELLRTEHDAGLGADPRPTGAGADREAAATPRRAGSWPNGPASHDAGVFARLTGWDIYVIGDTFSDGERGAARPAGRRHRGRARDVTVRHPARHRDRRRPAHGALARRHRHATRVLGAPSTGLGPPVGHARRLRRRRPPRPHAGSQLHHPVPRRLPPRAPAHDGRERRADDDPGPRRSCSASPTAASSARASTPISCSSIPTRSSPSCSAMVHDLPGGTSRLYAGSVGVRSVFVSRRGGRPRRRGQPAPGAGIDPAFRCRHRHCPPSAEPPSGPAERRRHRSSPSGIVRRVRRAVGSPSPSPGDGV